MSKQRNFYNKKNAPQDIKVDMDYMADPIWISRPDHYNSDRPTINSDTDLFPFPKPLKHILYCYQQAWETANSNKFIDLEDVETTYESNPRMSSAIDTSLSALHVACEDMLEAWLIENNWETKLHKR